MKLSIRFMALALATAHAATASAATLNDVVIHGAAADKILEKNELSAAVAEKIAKHCIDEAASKGMPVGVVILDQSGTVIYFYRGDGLTKPAAESPFAKAKTVMNTHAPSKAAMNAVYSGQSSDARQAIAGNVIQAGGLPIIVDHQFLGAIGVGGMQANPPTWSDEVCGYNALTAVLGPQPALLPDLPRPVFH